MNNATFLEEAQSTLNEEKTMHQKLAELRETCSRATKRAKVDAERLEVSYHDLKTEAFNLHHNDLSKTNKLHNAIDYINDPRKKYTELIIQEDMRFERLVETMNQIQNIDLTIKRPKTMINMLKNTVEQANNHRIEAALVEGEFR